MPQPDPALAALPLWPDTVDTFYADRACSIRSDATMGRKSLTVEVVCTWSRPVGAAHARAAIVRGQRG